MREKITYTIYGLFFFGGIFGLQAVAEADLPFLPTIGIIAAIFIPMFLGAKVVNKYADK